MRLLTRPLSILLLLSASLALGTWWYLDSDQPQIQYVTAAVERGEVSRLVIATGTVNPVKTVEVGTYVSGPIKEIFVDFNSPVTQNQRVAQLDPRPFLMKVKQAEASVRTAQAQVEKDQADLTFKQQVLKRTKDLFERSLIAEQEVEATERDYEQAVAQLQLDRARTEQQAAALEEARVNLGYTDIISPVDGVVVSRNVNVGQTVAASFQTPVLFLIAQDLTKMQVNANVSESDIGGVIEGQRAFFSVDAYPERQFWGQVSQVRNAPQTVQNVVTYDVVVTVENADFALKPGMTANISIISAHREGVLKVPLAALRFRPPDANGDGPSGERTGPSPRLDDPQIWIQANDASLQPVRVQTGVSDETDFELLNGSLSEGDQVVIGIQRHSADDERTTLPGFGMRWRRTKKK